MVKYKQIKGQRYKIIKSPYGEIFEIAGKDKTKIGKMLRRVK